MGLFTPIQNLLGLNNTWSQNQTLNGTNNTAPSQTAASGSSLMTRDLLDARVGGALGGNPLCSQSAGWRLPYSLVRASANFSINSAKVYYAYLYFDKPTTISKIGFNIATASATAADFQTALYTVDSGFQVSTLIPNSLTTGASAVTTTGDKFLTYATQPVVPRGIICAMCKLIAPTSTLITAAMWGYPASSAPYVHLSVQGNKNFGSQALATPTIGSSYTGQFTWQYADYSNTTSIATTIGYPTFAGLEDSPQFWLLAV